MFLLFFLIFLLIPVTALSQELYSYYLLSRELQVLSATKEKLPLSEVPRYTRVITRDQIDRWGVKNLFELLDRLPEFYYWRSYFGLNAVGALGLRQSYFSEKVQVLIDGMPVTDPSNGSSFSVDDIFSLSNVKQVEIVYGPMTSLYGFNASLAVINLVTYSPKEKSLNVESSISTGHDSYVSFLKSFRKNGFSGVFSLNYSEERSPHRSYTDVLGESAPYSSFKKSSVYYVKLKHSSGFYFKSYGVDRDDHFPLTLTHLITDGNTYADRRAFINRIGFKKSFAGYRVDLYANYNYFYLERGYNLCPFNHSFCKNFPPLRGVEPKAVEKRYVKNPGIGVLISKNLGSYGEFFLGAEYDESDLYKTELRATFLPSSFDLKDLSKLVVYGKEKRLPESEELLTPHLRTTFSPYFQYLVRINTYTVLLNGRWNRTNDVGNYWSYSFSLLKKIDRWNFKLNVGRAVRIPSFEEMYIKNNPILEGNPDLKGEKADSVMPSFEYKGDKFSISGMGYVYWFKDFIYKKPVSPLTYKWSNADSTVRVRGAVVSFKRLLFDNCELELSGTRIFGVSGLSGEYFEFPKKKLTAGFSYEGNSLSGSIFLVAYSRASSRIPGYGELNLNFSWSLNRNQRVSISVNNLLNKKVYYESRVPGVERTLWLEWRYSY